MSSIIKGITHEESDEVKPPKNNPVAKNIEKFNRPATHTDRKAREKAGYRKHKNDFFESITVPDPSIDGSYNDVYSGEEKIGHIILSPANQEYSWLELELPNPLAIVDVQIRSQYQGEGYFRELLNWLEDYAVKKGFKTLFLRVDDDSMIDQYQLENMYDHLGFSVYNDEYMNDEMDGLYMYKPLSSAKRESAIMKGIQYETKGTPYPGTYEQEYDPFKTKGQRRTTGMTY